MTATSRPPSVAVIIPAFRDWDGVARCLEALAKQTYPRDLITTVVVNNDPGDAPPAGVLERVHQACARIIDQPRPGSYAARNAGIAATHSEIIAFTDADCLPEPTWVENAILAITRGVDRVAGDVRVVAPHDPIGHAALHEIASAFDQRRYVRRGFGATANLVVQRDVFDRVGPFDPRLRSGGDIEWNQRAGRAGFTLAYVEDVRVRHPARSSTSALLEKDARVWRGKLAIEEFPRPVLALGSLAQGLLPPVAPVIRAGLRTRGRHRVGLVTHFVWLWIFRLRRAAQRFRLTVERPPRYEEGVGSIVIAVGSLVGGGAERSSLLIAKHWPTEHPLRPRLMVRELSGPFVTEIAPGLPVDVVGGTRSLQIPAFLWRTRRALRRADARAIISNSPRMSDVLLLGRRLRIIPCPIVIVERSGRLDGPPRGRWFAQLIGRQVRSSASMTVGVSEGIAQRVRASRHYGSTPTVVIHNAASVPPLGEQASQRFSSSAARPRFAALGRLEAVKNHSLLIDAFHAIPAESRGSLTIFGEGSLRGRLEAHIRELGLAEVTHLPGFVREPWDLLRQCDVFVLSSDFEGYPRVLMEALLCGLRVVATDCPTGPREILEGISGTRLIPQRDRVALRTAMMELAQEALEGTPARNTAEESELTARFDPVHMARQYAVVIDEVIA